MFAENIEHLYLVGPIFYNKPSFSKPPYCNFISINWRDRAHSLKP